MAEDEQTLEKQLTQDLLNFDREAMQSIGYNPHWYIDMVVTMGGRAAAKRLLVADSAQYGFDRLISAGMCNQTMEWTIIQEPWRRLFTRDELEVAEWRLRQAGCIR